MVRVGVVVSVCNTFENTKVLAVEAGKSARKAFGRGSQYTIIVLVLFRKSVGSVTHVSYNP